MAVTADDLVVIGRGSLIASGPIKNFTESAAHTVVHVAGPDIEAMARVLGEAGFSGMRRDPSPDYPYGVLDIQAADRSKIGHALHLANLEVHELSDSHSSLEDVFMELTHSSVEYGIGAPVPGLGWNDQGGAR